MPSTTIWRLKIPCRPRLTELPVVAEQAVPRRSLWRKATFETQRRAFFKIAVRIEELKSRVRVALPSAYPYRTAMISMAGCIAAQGP